MFQVVRLSFFFQLMMDLIFASWRTWQKYCVRLQIYWREAALRKLGPPGLCLWGTPATNSEGNSWWNPQFQMRRRQFQVIPTFTWGIPISYVILCNCFILWPSYARSGMIWDDLRFYRLLRPGGVVVQYAISHRTPLRHEIKMKKMWACQ